MLYIYIYICSTLFESSVEFAQYEYSERLLLQGGNIIIHIIYMNLRRLYVFLLIMMLTIIGITTYFEWPAIPLSAGIII